MMPDCEFEAAIQEREDWLARVARALDQAERLVGVAGARDARLLDRVSLMVEIIELQKRIALERLQSIAPVVTVPAASSGLDDRHLASSGNESASALSNSLHNERKFDT